MERTDTSTARARAAIVALAPIVLLIALVAHPSIGLGFPNDEAVAAAAAAEPTRWVIAHLIFGVASGLLLLAFLAIRSYVREAAEERSTAWAIPWIVVGSTLFTLLPGMEAGHVAVVKSGGDPHAFEAALSPWFVPTLFAGGLTFAVGVFAFARGLARSGVLSRGVTRLVVLALVAMAVSRLVPLALVAFYLEGAAAIVALLPVAYVMWAQPEARAVRQPRRVAA
jgi:ABC-type multidrug transport system permease subunit